MSPYLMPTLFLIGSIAFFIMSYVLKKRNNNRTFFSFITGMLLLICSIMGFFRYKNMIVFTIIIIAYYLCNALYDNKTRKSQAMDNKLTKTDIKKSKNKRK